jgi:hypothetical protein
MNRNTGTAAALLLSASLLALATGTAGAADSTDTTVSSATTQYAQTTTPAPATTAAPAAPAPAAPAAPAAWADGIKVNLQIEAGAVVNPANPGNGVNFGQLFTDRANQFVMNQALFGIQRPTDPKATDWDFGFSVQGLYGTDARYAQFLGMWNHAFASKYQMGLINANGQVHMPLLFDGGIDVKAGLFPTPLGLETIDPSTNPFYSHSYIFNFGLPLLSFGGLAVAHVSPVLDVYLGADSGVNTTVGWGDPNTAGAGTAGFGLNLMDGNLTILALTHFGPENSNLVVPNADGYFRYLNDVLITYKASDKLTLTTELNLIRDDYGFGNGAVNGFGGAQYVGYTLNDNVTLNGRAEVYRDDSGFFVAAFRGYHDFVNFQLGRPAAGAYGVGAATYGEITLGLTWKPTLPDAVNGIVSSFMIRPEIRYDQTLTNTKAFNNGQDRGAITLAADFVLGF